MPTPPPGRRIPEGRRGSPPWHRSTRLPPATLPARTWQDSPAEPSCPLSRNDEPKRCGEGHGHRKGHDRGSRKYHGPVGWTELFERPEHERRRVQLLGVQVQEGIDE